MSAFRICLEKMLLVNHGEDSVAYIKPNSEDG